MTDKVRVHSVSETARSRDGVDVLEVELMIQTSEKVSRTFTGDVYDDEVVLKSDPDKTDIPADDLKEMMAGAAHKWDQMFGDQG